MRMGQMVYFKDAGIIKQGFVSKELGDDLIVVCEDVSYTVKCWQIKKVPDKE